MLKRLRLWFLASLASIAALFSWQYVLAAASLTWTAPTQNTDSSPLTDLAGFRVYRRLGTTGTFTLLATVASPATTAYTDNATLEGMNCYTVTAFDDDGNESAQSNVACKTVDTLRPNAPSALTVN